jgi:hypothetical protein
MIRDSKARSTASRYRLIPPKKRSEAQRRFLAEYDEGKTRGVGVSRPTTERTTKKPRAAREEEPAPKREPRRRRETIEAHVPIIFDEPEATPDPSSDVDVESDDDDDDDDESTPAPAPANEPTTTGESVSRALAPATSTPAPITPAPSFNEQLCDIPNCSGCRIAKGWPVCKATGLKVYPPMSENGAETAGNALLAGLMLLARMARKDHAAIEPTEFHKEAMRDGTKLMIERRMPAVAAYDDWLQVGGAAVGYFVHAVNAPNPNPPPAQKPAGAVDDRAARLRAFLDAEGIDRAQLLAALQNGAAPTNASEVRDAATSAA